MRTSIKSRILRLSILCVLVMGFILTVISLVVSYILSVNGGHNKSDYAVNVCTDIISEEAVYLQEILSSSQPTLTGNGTFNKIFNYGDDVGYDYSAIKEDADRLADNQIEFTPPLTNENGSPVIMMLQKTGSNVIIGELDYDYFSMAVSAIAASDISVGCFQ